MQKYLVEIEWQVIGLSRNVYLDENLEEILSNLEKSCTVSDFDYSGEFIYFDVIVESAEADEAELLAKQLTFEAFKSVLEGSEMVLISNIAKELEE